MTDAWLIGLNASTYLIWYEDQNEKSRLHTVNCRIASYSDEESALKAVGDLGFRYKSTEIYDISGLEDISADTDCSLLLNFWNLFEDVHYSLGSVLEPELTELSERCYDKLFKWTDAASLLWTDCNDKYKPEFTSEETGYIRTLMKQGVNYLLNNIERLG